MQFGGYDESLVEQSILEAGQQSAKVSDSPDGIYWMEINSEFHWQVNINNCTFGEVPIFVSV